MVDVEEILIGAFSKETLQFDTDTYSFTIANTVMIAQKRFFYLRVANNCKHYF